MLDLNPTTLMITLYGNKTKAQLKKQKLSDWRNKGPTICCLQEIRFTYFIHWQIESKIHKKHIMQMLIIRKLAHQTRLTSRWRALLERIIL